MSFIMNIEIQVPGEATKIHMVEDIDANSYQKSTS